MLVARRRRHAVGEVVLFHRQPAANFYARWDPSSLSSSAVSVLGRLPVVQQMSVSGARMRTASVCRGVVGSLG